MPGYRSIKEVFTAREVMEGAGVRLKRVFSNNETPLTDPFLLLDDFHSDKKEDYIKGFPWHPHRGIETITYVLEGEVDHGDSIGNSGTISDGDVQWMTAGSGIIHQEMPKGNSRGAMWGFQLWANLPKSEKMCKPRYRDVKKSDVPVVETESGATIRVICGEAEGVRGPVDDISINPEYLDVTLKPGSVFTREVPDGNTLFAYVFSGSIRAAQEGENNSESRDGLLPGAVFYGRNRYGYIRKEQLALFSDKGKASIEAGEEGARFLLVSGKPLKEPVAWYGPIVMNTDEEIRRALADLKNGTFIR